MGQLNYVKVSSDVSSPNEYARSMGEQPKIKDGTESSGLNYAKVSSDVYSAPMKDVYYTGDTVGPSGVKYGESKYDKDVSFYDLGRLDAARADEQSFLSALGNGLLSRTTSVIPKFLEGAGFIATAPMAIAEGNIDPMVNNAFSNEMQKIDNQLRQALPVYASDSYSNGNWLSKMGTRKFWFDDAFDGLAFSASAFIPAGMIGKVGDVMGWGAKAIELAEGGNEIASTLLKNAPEMITTLYNSASEAGFEAKDTYNSIYKEMKKRGFSDEEAKLRASNGATHTFKANMAILLAPDFVESKFFLGGFKKGAKSIQKAVQESILNGSKKPIVNVAKQTLGKVALGIVSEGLWEEGIQNAVQQYEQRAAITNSYDSKNWFDATKDALAGYAEEYIKGYGTDIGITSMALGAITGGLMGGAFTYGQARAEKKEAEKIQEEFTDNLKRKLNTFNEFFKSNILDVADKNSGHVDINNLAREIFRTTNDKQAFDEETAAMAKDDKFHHLFNRKMNIARYMYGYLADRNFVDTDTAFKYAMDHLDKLKEENKDVVDEGEFAAIKRDAAQVKEAYDQIEKDRLRTDQFTADQKKTNFGYVVNKSILYETLKQKYLEEIRPELSEPQQKGVDNLIKDSQEFIKNVKNKSTRDELFNDYKDAMALSDERLETHMKLQVIQQELSEGKNIETGAELTEKEKEERQSEARKLSFKMRESEIMHGVRIDTPMEITASTKEDINSLRMDAFGVLNQARFSAAMRFEKNNAIKKAFEAYKNGNGSPEAVVAAVRDFTNEVAPYTKEDIRLLKSLQKDLRRKVNEYNANDELQSKYNTYQTLLKMMPENEAKESANISDEEIKEAENGVAAEKALGDATNIIRYNEEKAGRLPTNKELEEGLKPSRLRGIAMHQFLDEDVDPVANAYKNNPDSFSDVNGVERMINSLEAAEEALADKDHRYLRSSNIGKEVAQRIKESKALAMKMLDVAVKNESNKQAADVNSHRAHGMVISYAFRGESGTDLREMLNSYLGKNHVEKILEAMDDDNADPIYIDRLIKDINKLDEGDRNVIISKLKEALKNKVDEAANTIMEKAKETQKFKAVPHKRMYNFLYAQPLNRYKTNPMNSFKEIIGIFFGVNTENDFMTPLEKYSTFSDFNDLVTGVAELMNGPNKDVALSSEISNEDLATIISMQAEVASLENIVSALETEEYDRGKIVDDEIKEYNNTESKIHPSRQQRITISQLVKWFKSKGNNRSNIFSYLRGIAGTGKTTVVGKHFLKMIGVKAENILATAKNETALENLNNSIGTDGKKAVASIEKEDITDDIKIIVLDEVGAVESDDLKSFISKVNEVNKEREERGVNPVKVLMMGDPTQITGTRFFAAIEEDKIINNVAQPQPLTIAYRSNISEIVNFQTMFINNKNEIRGVQTVASAPVGQAATGVHSGNKRQLLRQLEVQKDNGKSKVIIVSNKDQVAEYEGFKDKIKNLEVLTVEEVQGRTFDEAYVDLDLSKYDNTNVSEAAARTNNLDRNKIIYTATSRASDYIFMVDNTSSFTNKTSPSVEKSKEENEKQLDEYSTTYGSILEHDSGILDGKKTVKKTKKTAPPTGETDGKTEVKDDEIEKTTSPEDVEKDVSGPDVYPEVQDDEVEVDNSTGSKEGEFQPKSDDVHDLEHPESSTEDNVGTEKGTRSLVKPGDKAYYVYVTYNGRPVVVVISPKVKDDLSKGFFLVGFLNQAEAKKYTGKTIGELNGNIFPPPFSAGEIKGFKPDANYVLRDGEITAAQALTYMFKKGYNATKDAVGDLMSKLATVFNPRNGYKYKESRLHIYSIGEINKLKNRYREEKKMHVRDAEIDKMRNPDNIVPGVPYFEVKYTTKSGSTITQYVRMAPRKMNANKDNALLKPIIDFRDTVKNINDLFKKHGVNIRYGSPEYNRLLKEFKKNYRVNSKNELEIISPKDRLTFADVKDLAPGLNKEAFEATKELFDSIIPMIYGVGEKRVKMDESGFSEWVDENGLSKVDGEIDGVSDLYFAGDASKLDTGKGRYYKFDQNSGHIRYFIPFEKNGETKLRNDRVDGIEKKYLTDKQIMAGKGQSQLSLNAIAKNNATPGGVTIRTNKIINGKKVTSSKSLVKGLDTRGEYLTKLRRTISEKIADNNFKDPLINPYQEKVRNLSQEDQIELLEDEITSNGIMTQEQLAEIAKEDPVSAAFTVEDLDKILSIDEKTGESNSLRLPLNRSEFNKKGSNLDNEENMSSLNGDLESNLEEVKPTAVQIKLNGKRNIEKTNVSKLSGVEAKEETSTIERAGRRSGRRAKKNKESGEDDIIIDDSTRHKNRNILATDPIYNEHDKVSREQFVDEIKKRIPGIKDYQVKFVESILINDPISGRKVFARARVIGKTIEVAETADNMYYREVAKHEAFHYAKNNLITKEEYEDLVDAFSSEFGDDFTKLSDLEQEEFIARKYQQYKVGDYVPKESIIHKIFKYIADLFNFVSDNAEYIETMFRSIEEGRFQKSSIFSVGNDLPGLRKKFGTTENFKSAKGYIVDNVDSIIKNGIKRRNGEVYPVATIEIPGTTKTMMRAILRRNEDTLEQLFEDRDMASSPEELSSIEEKIEELSKQISIYSITIANFDQMFKLTYPNWSRSVTVENEDEDQFGDDEIEGSQMGISDDIIDWERVDMQQKTSSSVKNELSNIEYTDVYGRTSVVNEKYAYLKTLEIFNRVDANENNLAKQLEQLYKREKDLKDKAIIKRIMDIYNEVSTQTVFDNRSGEYVKVRNDIRFFDEGTVGKDGKIASKVRLVIANDLNSNLWEFNGLESMKEKGVDIIEIENTFPTLRDFIDHIIEEYGGDYNISYEDLFDAYSFGRKKNSFTELVSNAISQRKRNIRFIEEKDNGSSKTFRYSIGNGRTVTTTYKSAVSEAITENSLTKADAIAFNSAVGTMYSKVKRSEKPTADQRLRESTDIVQGFLNIIGFGQIADLGKVHDVSELHTAASKIKYLFVDTNTIADIIKDAENKFDPKKIKPENGTEITEEDIKRNEDAKNEYINKQVRNKMATLIRSIGNVIEVDANFATITSVRAADGKKKYLYVVSNQALEKLKKSVKLLAKENPNNKTLQNSIYASGISKIHQVLDHDGIKTTKVVNNDNVIIEYKDEKYIDAIDRAFSAQFLGMITEGTADKARYAQSPYVVSNKPVHNPVVVDVLNKSKQDEAIKSMLNQIFDIDQFDDIKGFDKHKLINLTSFARAIERTMPGSTEAVYNKKNGSLEYYKIKEDRFKKLESHIKNEDRVFNEIVRNAKSELRKDATELAKNIINRNIVLDLNGFINERTLNLLDKEGRKATNKLKRERHINPVTNKLVYGKEREDATLKFSETYDDVMERISKTPKYKKLFSESDFNDRDSFFNKVGELRSNGVEIDTTPKALVSIDEILPVIELFVANDTIQSHQVTQITSGDYRFYDGPTDLVKRLSGAFAPGIIGYTGKGGMPRYTNAAIISDPVYDRKTIGAFLRDNLGVREEDVAAIEKMYGTDMAEYADGQGFVTPERYEELKTGFGDSYKLGNVMKPAYFHIDENGVPRMLKYSTIVLTDDLCNNNPQLAKLREKMRKGGEDGAMPIGELVFASGNKVGQPKNLSNIYDIIENDGFISKDSMFTIDNTDYRMQLNPLHSSFDSVANPTQLVYFLNTSEHNELRASRVYNNLANMIKNKLSEQRSDLITTEGIIKAIERTIGDKMTYIDHYELLQDLKNRKGISSPWDFPSLTSIAMTSLNSYINKHISKIRFPGTKAVLQTAFGTENLDEETKKLSHTLEYNHEDVEGYNNKDIMYAETIMPRGLLPSDVEKRIEKEIEEDKKNGGRGIAQMEFITPDALGFRLPSSELHSAVPLRVRGFYDSQGTNVIIAPRQIVDLHGSDYDVDSLFTIVREYETDEKGKRTSTPVGYKYNEKTKKYEFDHKFLNSKEFDKLTTREKDKYYKNAILEDMLDVVSSIENRSKMATPITIGFIKDDIKELNKLKSISKTRVNDLSNFQSRQRYHASSYEASTAVGIWANGIKVIAYLQKTNNGNNPELYTHSEDGKADDKGMWFGGKRYAVLSNDPEMYRVLDGFLNSAIDNVKEQDLPELNMTSQNIKAYIALLGFGFSMKDANRIFSQDTISYMNTNDINSGALLNELKGILITYGADLEDLLSTKELSTSKLEGALSQEYDTETILNKFKSGEKLTEEEVVYLKVQYTNLMLFNQAMSIGNSLSKISKVLKPLRDAPVSFEEIEDLVEAKNDIIKYLGEDLYQTKEVPFDFSSIMNKLPHLKAAYQVLEFQYNLEKNRFFKYNQKIKDGLDLVHNKVKVKYSQDKVENAQKMYSEFANFIQKQVKFDPEYKGFDNEKPYKIRNGKVVYYGERAFKERFIDSITTLKKDPRFKNNKFIQSLELTRDMSGRRTLRFPVGVNMDFGDILDFQNHFEELVNYDVVDGKIIDYNLADKSESETMGYSPLQKNFFRFLIADRGLGFFSDSYEPIIPSRMKVAYQREFEKLLYSKETGILTSKEHLDKIMSIYETNLAINHPENVSRSASASMLIRNEDSSTNEYVGRINGRMVYADRAYKVRMTDGKIDMAKTKRTHREYIRTEWKDKNTGEIKYNIYKRVAITDKAVLYTRVGNKNRGIEYAQLDTANLAEYDENRAFSPYYKHTKVTNYEGNKFESYKVHKSGEIIGISLYSDPARVDMKFVKITKVSTVKVGDKIKYKYEYKEIQKNRIDYDKTIVKDRVDGQPDSMRDVLEGNHKSVITKTILQMIRDEVPEHAQIARTLIKFNSTRFVETQFYGRKTKHAGITETSLIPSRAKETGRSDLSISVKIPYKKFDSVIGFAESIVHENVHRYTSLVLNAYMLGRDAYARDNSTSPSEYMRQNGFTNDEIIFARRVHSLHEEFKEANKGKGNLNPFTEIMMNDITEFVAYGLTKKGRIIELKTIKVKNKGLFKQLIDFIADLFGVKSETMYDFLYGAFERYARDSEFASKMAISVKGSLKDDFVVEYVNNVSNRNKMELIEDSKRVLDYNKTLSNPLEDPSTVEFQSAALLARVAVTEPEYKRVAEKLLELDNHLHGRIRKAELTNDVGFTKIEKGKNNNLQTTVLIDFNYINSLSEDPEIRNKEMASTILHEELHRYTALLDATKHNIPLTKYEEEYIENMKTLLHEAENNLELMLKYDDNVAKEILNDLNGDISELVAYGLSEPTVIEYFKRMASPFNDGLNLYEALEQKTFELFDRSSKDMKSVMNNIVETDRIPIKELNVGESVTEEGLQRDVIKCGL